MYDYRGLPLYFRDKSNKLDKATGITVPPNLRTAGIVHPGFT